MVASVTAKRVLAVSGGTGFVGQHLLRIATEAGYPVRGLTRKPQVAQPAACRDIVGQLQPTGATTRHIKHPQLPAERPRLRRSSKPQVQQLCRRPARA